MLFSNLKKLVFTGLLLIPLISSAQGEKAFDINEKLGRGINFGNMFEAPFEGEWGAEWKPEYSKIISDLGFNHVRIPTRWEPENRSSDSPPYTINPNFLNRMKQVVDSALNNGLYAIINMHHHEALYENPIGNKPRFLSQWQQIADFFKNYSDSLLFEILNEPHGNLDAETWNIFLVDALETIRESNPERIVLIGTAEWGGLGGLSQLQIPDDDNIILTIHYYNPFHFTHQGAEWSEGSEAWMGTEWMDTETERGVIRQEFAPLIQLSKEIQIPIHIGEFGAYEKADMESRIRWTTFLTRYLESLNWSWAYWEFCAGFGIYNPDSMTYKQGLIDALLYNEMPEAFEYNATEIYKTNFSWGTSGWNRYTQSTASGQLTSNGSQMTVSISNGGAESWHFQIARNNMELYEGKKYRISFIAKADEQRSITAYMGMSSTPWSAYGEYNSITLADTFAYYAYMIDMDVTDLNSRIVFDLGNSDVDVVFKEIKLEELSIATGLKDFQNTKQYIYPNPAENTLYFSNKINHSIIEIFNANGNKLISKELHNKKYLNVSELIPGIYILKIKSGDQVNSFKFIKK